MHQDDAQAVGPRPATSLGTDARSTPLASLLGVFGAVVFAILLLLLRVQPHGEARAAARPTDFPGVFGTDPSVEGLTAAAVGSAARAVIVGPSLPLNPDTFPCTQCHDNKDLTTNPERRALRQPHDEAPFEHKRIWCLECHDANNRDKLHLANGELLDLTTPLRLCAQCHGILARDWERGIHGKRTGYWNGQKRIVQCVQCHDPHSPRFKALEPLPPPVEPGFLRTDVKGAATSAPKENHK